jgi:hypothetical protein
MTLFPMIQPEMVKIDEDVTEYQMYREVQWNYEHNIPVYKNGIPVIVEGSEAVKVWAWKALHTERFRYEIYTWDYGDEAKSLIGKPFSEELKQSEAARYVRECLMVNPYITSVTDTAINFSSDDVLSVSAIVTTIYGEVTVNV